MFLIFDVTLFLLNRMKFLKINNLNAIKIIMKKMLIAKTIQNSSNRSDKYGILFAPLDAAVCSNASFSGL